MIIHKICSETAKFSFNISSMYGGILHDCKKSTCGIGIKP